jgi:plasmid stabilization system protein ParE
MKAIRWSEQAIEDYDRNLEYLQIEWTEREEIIFNLKVAKTLRNISAMPELYPVAIIGSTIVRKAVITPQITLYYLVLEDQILLVRFKNNFQAPNSGS